MLEIVNVCKNFVNKASQKATAEYAVDHLNLTIEEGEFFSLLGPSGCGKTTLLRMIAGLEHPSSGQIRFKGQAINHLPAQDRPFNMVFQKYALFPHLTVFENVAFGLKLKKLSKEEIKSRVEETLALVNMSAMAQRFPETLSGGQSQRVAIARALVNRPQILLLDEPLSALDQKLREHMQTELKLLQRKLGLTFIYVTHDQEEALALSDRIGVMNHGKLEQVSKPQDLYDEPTTLFAAQFVGPMTSIEGEFMEMEGNLARFKFGENILKARPRENAQTETARSALALVRPERLKLLDKGAVPAHMNKVSGRISNMVFRGTQTEVNVEISPTCTVKAFIGHGEPGSKSLKIGSDISLAFDPEDTFLFLGKLP